MAYIFKYSSKNFPQTLVVVNSLSILKSLLTSRPRSYVRTERVFTSIFLSDLFVKYSRYRPQTLSRLVWRTLIIPQYYNDTLSLLPS